MTSALGSHREKGVGKKVERKEGSARGALVDKMAAAALSLPSRDVNLPASPVLSKFRCSLFLRAAAEFNPL
ncbi:hypothetical protein MRX96_043497 [Rhipicephalus microplus]